MMLNDWMRRSRITQLEAEYLELRDGLLPRWAYLDCEWGMELLRLQWYRNEIRKLKGEGVYN